MIWLWTLCTLQVRNYLDIEIFRSQKKRTYYLTKFCFSGYCHFENGLCGLTSENSTEFQWSTGLGKTPSENTGPDFDHTTFTDKGTCTSIGLFLN